MSQASKLALIKELIESAESGLRSAKQILSELTGAKSVKTTYAKVAETLDDMDHEGDDTIVEGVYNGQMMIDKNKKEYPVPANYASKSKLIPGDVLKLTIKPDGSFVYKQIGPIPRKRIVGTLTYEDGQYKVIASGKAYKVLLASVTYFKGEIGNKVTIVVPEVEDSEWAAIENVMPLEAEKLDI
ncbi:MAG: hypothetical protein WC651_04930 [Candidatus Gracilibacteria bacterium]|jgi:hypothetical protein